MNKCDIMIYNYAYEFYIAYIDYLQRAYVRLSEIPITVSTSVCSYIDDGLNVMYTPAYMHTSMYTNVNSTPSLLQMKL